MSIGLDCAQCGATVKGKVSDSLQHIVLGFHHFGGRVGTEEKTTLLKWAFLHKRALSAPQLSAAPRNRLKKSGQYGTCGPDALILEGKK